MRRGAMLVMVVALLGGVGSGTAAAAGGAPGYSARPACTTGQLRCMLLVLTRNGTTVRAATASALPAGYGPDQYHTAYALPTQTPLVAGTSDRKPVTVAVVDAFDYGNTLNDLNTYSAAFGLPAVPSCSHTVKTACFQKINMGAPSGSARSHGWDLEIAQDIETIHAICENCRIVLVESVDDTAEAMAVAENRAAQAANIVSNSYGSYDVDGSEGALDAYYDHPNKAIVVSSGDDGYGVSWPAALNTVVSVGGTSLHVAADNSYVSETAWGPNATYTWGTGSGCADGHFSGFAPIPAAAFQAAVAGYANTGCGTSRGENDVSANADPDTGTAMYARRTGWIQTGGTSIAAPLIAATFALKANMTKAAYPASFIYAKAGTSAFNDVTSGSNDGGHYTPCDTTTTQCVAAPGYDLPTGVGSPHGVGGF